MNLFLKLVRKGLRSPVRLFEWLEMLRKTDGCEMEEGSHIYPTANIANLRGSRGAITLGANTRIFGELIVFPHGGTIALGANCFLGENSRVWSTSSIRIGDRVLISHNVNIHDNDSHSLSAAARADHFTQIFRRGHPSQLDGVASNPIVIEDDVWIGFNATILKGVTIGRGAVVGACSVVTKDIAPMTVVAGNPARVIGRSRL